MKPVREIISRELIDSLWGYGYTVVPRRMGDLFYVDPAIIPPGMAYEWKAKADMEWQTERHWRAVPASRHIGLFAPAGFEGDTEFGGLILMEKDKAEVDADRTAQSTAAHKQETEWRDRFMDAGLSGGARVVGDVRIFQQANPPAFFPAREIDAGAEDENATKIPPELTPYIKEILAERDRLLSFWEGLEAQPPARDKATALVSAIATIRERHKELSHGTPETSPA